VPHAAGGGRADGALGAADPCPGPGFSPPGVSLHARGSPPVRLSRRRLRPTSIAARPTAYARSPDVTAVAWTTHVPADRRRQTGASSARGPTTATP
jgi:hypothetical protein